MSDRKIKIIVVEVDADYDCGYYDDIDARVEMKTTEYESVSDFVKSDLVKQELQRSMWNELYNLADSEEGRQYLGTQGWINVTGLQVLAEKTEPVNEFIIVERLLLQSFLHLTCILCSKEIQCIRG